VIETIIGEEQKWLDGVLYHGSIQSDVLVAFERSKRLYIVVDLQITR